MHVNGTNRIHHFVLGPSTATIHTAPCVYTLACRRHVLAPQARKPGETMVNDKDRVWGCFIGGAIGDALGYPIEFWQEDQIDSVFGPEGIQTLEQAAELSRVPQAVFSDDTQMTLFTAAGLIYGAEQHGTPESSDVWLAYREWFATQGNNTYLDDPAHPKLWLTSMDAMHHRRAPGNTCLYAIQGGVGGTILEPVNNSKGCGGVMRAAPVGLVAHCLRRREQYRNSHRYQWATRMAAESAALTHGHPMGWLPAAVLAQIVARSCANDEADPLPLSFIVQHSVQSVAAQYATFPEAELLVDMVMRAIELSHMSHATPEDDRAHIHELGEGWVGEEALCVAIYAALSYENDFAAAIRCAVNHWGDSDSTGAICGNILGAYLGFDAFKADFTLLKLEQIDLLLKIADDMIALEEL